MIFAISDMKEGFEKDFWDAQGLFDVEVPFFIVLDPHQTRPKKYLYPSDTPFTFSSGLYPPPQTSELLAYLLSLQSKTPFYRSAGTSMYPQSLQLI